MQKVETELPLSPYRARVMHAVCLARQRRIPFARAFNLIGDLERRFERGFWLEDPRKFWSPEQRRLRGLDFL